MRMHARGALFRLFSSPGHSKRGLGKAGRSLFDIMSINGISHFTIFSRIAEGPLWAARRRFCSLQAAPRATIGRWRACPHAPSRISAMRGPSGLTHRARSPAAASPRSLTAQPHSRPRTARVPSATHSMLSATHRHGVPSRASRCLFWCHRRLGSWAPGAGRKISRSSVLTRVRSVPAER